jgi:tRNA pseudouridine55 synthase
VEREPRPIRIDEISMLEIAGTRLVFWVHCSKGTYVRTLVEDIAKKAGTVAHTARLHRESVGDFRADDMLDLTGLEEAAASGLDGLKARLLPPDTALERLAAVELDNEASDRFAVGQVNSVSPPATAGLVRVYGKDKEFLGVGELSVDGQLAPKRVFKTGEKNP